MRTNSPGTRIIIFSAMVYTTTPEYYCWTCAAVQPEMPCCCAIKRTLRTGSDFSRSHTRACISLPQDEESARALGVLDVVWLATTIECEESRTQIRAGCWQHQATLVPVLAKSNRAVRRVVVCPLSRPAFEGQVCVAISSRGTYGNSSVRLWLLAKSGRPLILGRGSPELTWEPGTCLRCCQLIHTTVYSVECTK